MKKTYFVALLLLVLVIGLTACSGADTSVKDGDDMTTDDTQEVDSSNDAVAESASIQKLIDNGNSVHCSYDGAYGEGNIEYDVYVDGEKFSVYSTISTPEMTEDSFVINDGEKIYIWGSSMDQGMVMGLDYLEEDDGSSSFDFDYEYNYVCSNWKPSKDSFNPPSDVDFMDMTALLEGFEDMYG